MRETLDISPLTTSLGLRSPNIISERGDTDNALAFGAGKYRIIVHFGKLVESLCVFIADENSDLWSKSVRVVPIEHALDFKGIWHDELFEGKETVEEQMKVYADILRTYISDYIEGKSDFEKLVIFNKGFNFGYTYANME